MTFREETRVAYAHYRSIHSLMDIMCFYLNSKQQDPYYLCLSLLYTYLLSQAPPGPLYHSSLDKLLIVFHDFCQQHFPVPFCALQETNVFLSSLLSLHSEAGEELPAVLQRGSEEGSPEYASMLDHVIHNPLLVDLVQRKPYL